MKKIYSFILLCIMAISTYSQNSPDVNDDGNVNSADVVAIYNAIIEGWQAPPKKLTFREGGVTFNMIKVEGGTFMMGTPADWSDIFNDEKPSHEVTLSTFYIGETEVTQILWDTFMDRNPSYHRGADLPVNHVVWDDCQEFIEKLNIQTGRKFRLPTEAEWEYAARGGIYSKGYTYSGSNSADNVSWHADNCYYTTHPVMKKAPNELGLYDMSGNVAEWCQDWFGAYEAGPQTNPTGPKTGTKRVVRGGSIHFSAPFGRVAGRDGFVPGYTGDIGFRLVLVE